MAFVTFHLLDNAKGLPLGSVVADAVADGPAPWAAESNPCGDMKTELQGYVSKDQPTTHYEITFRKAGYNDRTLPADIGDSGIIYVGLDKSGTNPIVPPVGPLPPIPARNQVCALQTSLAGLMYDTTEYGSIPAWFYGALNPTDRAIARAAHKKAGDTHIPFPVTEAYREGGTLWPPDLANGYDYTQNLDAYRALALEIIRDGFFVDCSLGGDGLGNGPDYNDWVGRTYGHGWLVQNLPRMLTAFQGDGSPARPDITKYTIYRAAWDSQFYGWGGSEATQRHHHTLGGLRWRYVHHKRPTLSAAELDDQQQRVKAFGEQFRSLLPGGYLSIEHTPGNIPCGEGGSDYSPGGLMTTFDTILSEYNTVHEDSYWQIVGRMISPYHRPPDQPAGDDPNPPFYLAPGSPRGPYFYCAFEPTQNGVYEFCRGKCTREAMQQQDAYMRASGVTLTGYPVHW